MYMCPLFVAVTVNCDGGNSSLGDLGIIVLGRGTIRPGTWVGTVNLASDTSFLRCDDNRLIWFEFDLSRG